MKMMRSRRWQHGSPWQESATGTAPTATVTGRLLCQAQFTSVDSSLVLTTTLGSVHHRPPPPVLLPGSTVTRSRQSSWKLSSGSHHTRSLWWWSSVTLVPGQRLLSTCLHTTQHRRVSLNSTGSGDRSTGPTTPPTTNPQLVTWDLDYCHETHHALFLSLPTESRVLVPKFTIHPGC